jgi:hypothetical protein
MVADSGPKLPICRPAGGILVMFRKPWGAACDSFSTVTSTRGVWRTRSTQTKNRGACFVPMATTCLVSFDRLEVNPVPKAAGDAVPRSSLHGAWAVLLRRPARIGHDLLAAGFTNVEVETIKLSSECARCRPRPGVRLPISVRDRAAGPILSWPCCRCGN